MESKDTIESLIELQEYLMGINYGNYEESKNFVLETYLNREIETYSSFFRTLFIGLMYRPSETELFIKLLSDIFEIYRTQEFITDFNRVLFDTIFHLPGPSIAGLFVLYRLYEQKHVEIDEIINKIRLFRFQNNDRKINLIYCFLWFAPEIYSHNKSLFSLLNSDFEEFSQNNPINLFLKNFKLDSLFSKDFELLRHYRKSGHNHQCLFRIILNDDIESLQKQTVDPTFEYDQTVNSSFFEICPFIQNEPTLIEVSAFFGSLKCFKYLLLNGSNLILPDHSNESLPHFAVAGGNVEIIRICNQKKLPLDGTIQIASLFHRTEIIDWLIDGENQEVGDVARYNGTIIQNAAISNNLAAIQMCFEKGVDVNEGNLKRTSLQNACENGNIESVSLLLSSKDIDINACVFKYFVFFIVFLFLFVCSLGFLIKFFLIMERPCFSLYKIGLSILLNYF